MSLENVETLLIRKAIARHGGKFRLSDYDRIHDAEDLSSDHRVAAAAILA